MGQWQSSFWRRTWVTGKLSTWLCDGFHGKQRENLQMYCSKLLLEKPRLLFWINSRLKQKKRKALVGENRSCIWWTSEFDIWIEILSMCYGMLRGTLGWTVMWLITNTKIIIRTLNPSLELTMCWCFVTMNYRFSHAPLM